MRKWPLLLVLVAVVLIVGALWFGRGFAPAPSAPPAPPAVAQSAPAAKPEPAKPAPQAPSFDIVRVAPDGGMVVAGRADAGAMVSLRADGREIASAKADAQGQFALVPDEKLAPGGRELSLAATGADGKAIPGQAPVVVAVPEPAQAGTAGSVAVLAAENAPPKLLGAPALPGDAQLGLDVVDYDAQGAIRFTGRAQPGETLRLYVDNTPLGETRAGSDGAWSLTPAGQTVAPGQHRVRVDEIGAGGAVTARIELPFLRSLQEETQTAQAQGGGSQHVVVRPGENLWRIARQAYGHGIRYWVIYRANRGQIRDPNRIYPGQVFSLPASHAVAGHPAAEVRPAAGAQPAAVPPSAVPPLPAGLVTPSMPPSSVSKSR